MVILMPNPYEDINKGPLTKYSFLSLPILGKYNDYGDIEDVVKDKNVEVLEKFFGIPIEGITECASDCRKDSGVEYNQFGSIQKWYGVKNISLGITKKNLEDFGCVIAEDGTITHPKVKFPEFAKFVLEIGETEFQTKIHYTNKADFSSVEKIDRYERLFGYFNKFLNIGKHYYSWQKPYQYIFGVPDKFQLQAKILHEAAVVFFKKEIFDGYLNIHLEGIKNDETYQKYYKKYDEEAKNKFVSALEEDKNKIEKDSELRFLKRMVHREILEHGLVSGFSNFSEIYWDNALDLTNEFEKMHFFKHMLYKLNREIQPTRSLEQHGCKSEQIPFIKFYLNLLEKEVKAENGD
jgi:hypothetical protein